MKELSLQELKDIEFDMLKMFHGFCIENNIKYFLAYGTLLGAIRYGGFIPWDDDVDLLVPREDYERLIKLFQDNERYRLYAFEKNQDFLFPFAKLCDMTTSKEEFNMKSRVPLGVDIDIFPLDYWDNNLEKAKEEAKRIRKNMSWLDLTKIEKAMVVNPAKKVVKIVLMAVCKTLGGKFFIKRILKESYKREQNGSSYIGSKTWCVYGERGIIPSEAFSNTIEVEFEGEKFYAPIGYDTYLTCLYGDYLPEPPKEKQKTHHNFKAYRVKQEDRNE